MYESTATTKPYAHCILRVGTGLSRGSFSRPIPDQTFAIYAPVNLLSCFDTELLWCWAVRSKSVIYRRGSVRDRKKHSDLSHEYTKKLVVAGKKIKPSRQGDLDALCGIYSLVNAMTFLYGKKIKRNHLRMALLGEFSTRWDAGELINEGMDVDQLDHLIANVLQSGYYNDRFPIEVGKPFVRAKRLRIHSVIDRMQLFLSSTDVRYRGIVLIGTAVHWTLIYHIDSKYLYWFDSSDRSKSYRRSYSLRSGRVAHVLRRDSIYFLVRAEKVGI